MSLTQEPPGSRVVRAKNGLQHLIVAGTDTATLSNPAVSDGTRPATNALRVKNYSKARFWIAGTDAADETINYQVIAWYLIGGKKGRNLYLPMLVAKGVATLGAMVVPAAMIATGGKFADTITQTLTVDGTVAVSPADDSAAMLEVDLRGAVFVSIETDLGTGAAADVLIQLGD